MVWTHHQHFHPHWAAELALTPLTNIGLFTSHNCVTPSQSRGFSQLQHRLRHLDPSRRSSALHNSDLRSSRSTMSSPTASQDSEANADLTALYKQLEEQEGTIREQAERLIKKDEQYQASLKDLADAKDRAVAELQVKLAQSEEEIEKLMASIKTKDQELTCRRHHSRVLAAMCRSQPMLASLHSLMEEANQIPCLPNVGHGNGSSLPSVHHHAQSNEDSDVDTTLFGTTV